MTLVAGVDSSTQSCKVLIVDAATGRVVREGRAARGEHSLEEELMKPEEEEAMLKAEQDAESGSQPQPLSGFPDDGNPANAEFEELLKKQVLGAH